MNSKYQRRKSLWNATLWARLHGQWARCGCTPGLYISSSLIFAFQVWSTISHMPSLHSPQVLRWTIKDPASWLICKTSSLKDTTSMRDPKIAFVYDQRLTWNTQCDFSFFLSFMGYFNLERWLLTESKQQCSAWNSLIWRHPNFYSNFQSWHFPYSVIIIN